jgi:hypothetical protein
MRFRGLILIPLFLVPASAMAREVELCASLYRQLHSTPVVIGNTAEMRRYAQDLSKANSDIRKLRVDMRRAGCGGGSIVSFGAAKTEQCEPLLQELQALEENREAVVAERNKARNLSGTGEERGATIAAIRQNACIPSDFQDVQKAEEKERMRVKGIALPKDEEDYSGSITNLRTREPVSVQQVAIDPTPPVPERDYEASSKVRMVGPVFLPEASIDLRHPRENGPQQQQQ